MALPPTAAMMIAFLETYHDVSIPPTMEFVRNYLQKYHAKVFVLKNNADRERLLQLLEHAQAANLKT